MARTKFFGGNWKCNGSKKSISELLEVLNAAVVPKNVEVVVAPTFLHVDSVLRSLKSEYQMAGQNCSSTGNGAFTGEQSADQLVNFGIPWVILGHSERRQLYKETDKLIGQKVKYALAKGLKVIACIGETLQERKDNQTMQVCIRQLQAIGGILKKCSFTFNPDNVSDWSRVVIAYEPVWAIGTGVTATSAQAQEVHAAIRAWLVSTYGASVASGTRIIYGGSVKGSNAAELMSMLDVDGALIGGASLNKEFVEIFSASSVRRSKL